MKINDREFRIIVPKFDNSGQTIKKYVLKRIIGDMTDHFDGSTTYPAVLGCWRDKDTNETICEENFVITSIRDSESTPNFKKQVTKDERFIRDFADKIGKELGQKSITQGTSKTEVSFIPGEFRKRLSKKAVGLDPFSKLI